MGGGKAWTRHKTAQPAAQVWSKPARSSKQRQQDDHAATPVPVQPEPVAPPVQAERETSPAQPELITAPVAPEPEASPSQPEPKAVEKTDNDDAPQTSPAKENKPEVPAETPDSCPSSKPEAGPDPTDLLKQASDLESKGEYTPALSLLQQAFERASSTSDQRTAAAALHAHARVLYHLKREADALEYVNRSIALNKTLKNARARSHDLILAGKILMAMSEFPEALKSFEEAQKILPESEASMRPELMENMASCLLRLDKYPEALAALNRGLAYCLKAANQAEAGRIHLLMGEISLSRSDYAAARSNFNKALKLYKDADGKKDVGETLLRIAYLDHLQGNLKASRGRMQEGMALIGDGTDSTATTLSRVVRGLGEADEGNVIQAASNLSSALNQYERVGDRTMASARTACPRESRT